MINERSGFFGSVDGDRTYSAADWAWYFRMIYNDGVIHTEPDLMDTEYLKIKSVGTNSVTVGKGRAVIHGYAYELIDDGTLTTATPHTTMDRIDSLIIHVDTTTDRSATMTIKTGTAASSPEPPVLTNTDTVKELKLADILIRANTPVLSIANVTDCRVSACQKYINAVDGVRERCASVRRNAGGLPVMTDFYNSSSSITLEDVGEDSETEIFSIPYTKKDNALFINVRVNFASNLRYCRVEFYANGARRDSDSLDNDSTASSYDFYVANDNDTGTISAKLVTETGWTGTRDIVVNSVNVKINETDILYI